MNTPQGSDSSLRLDSAEPAASKSPRSRSTPTAADPYEALELFFELSPDVFCIVGRDGFCERANPAFQRVVGRGNQECLTRRLLDFVHAADRSSTQDQFERLTAGEPEIFFENRLVDEDGGGCRISWNCVCSPGRDKIYCVGRRPPDGGRMGEQTQRVVQQNEEKLRAISDSALDAVIMMDQRGRVVHWNPAAERMFGYQTTEILGRNVHETLVPEQHLPQARVGLQRFAQTGDGPAVGKVLELSALRKDGGQFPIEIAVSSFEVEGVWWATAIIRDVSERKREQRKFREREIQLLAAQRIQRHLLPDRPPDVPGLNIAGATYPAQFAAGDLYDYLPMPGNCLGVVVSDVSGHGFGPALLVASTQTLLEKLAETCNDVGRILTEANKFLAGGVEEDRFITIFLAGIDLTARTLTYASAGHPPGYVFGRDGAVKHRMESTWPPLAVLAEGTIPAAEPVELADGDTIVLLTDGVLEARSPDLEPFGSRRTLEVVRANLNCTPREMIDRLHRVVCEFSGTETLSDDVTAMVVKVGPR